MLTITAHAIDRYRERVADLPRDEIIRALSSPVIEQAARMGAVSVILGTGQRVVLAGSCVVTIKPKGSWRGSMDPRRNHVSNFRYREN